ncbi:QRFP-like peptide receptor [Nematostella vectensis]|uniref:QRFP-like peptide receptor n=1 Tax=Nematostella vectensis TaxID=45351 RepID=UPI0020778639|nr:QRFP-like peptide receptor [Nematostella vectensis]
MLKWKALARAIQESLAKNEVDLTNCRGHSSSMSSDKKGGVFLLVTPGYAIPPQSFPRLTGIGGKVFCRLVFSTYCIFVLGKASNATIMCIAIERWYAVVMPTKYKAKFGRRRIYGYIGLIWLSASITEIFELFITKLGSDGRCRWVTPFYGVTLENAFVVLHITITFYIPSVVTWASFGHIWIRLRQDPMRVYRDALRNFPGNSYYTVLSQSIHRNRTMQRVVRMCALAALFLTVCWLPIETFWILKKYQIVILTQDYYMGFSMLAFFSACVNPMLYCLANRTYRREVFRLCTRHSRVVPYESRDMGDQISLENLPGMKDCTNAVDSTN